MSAENDPASGGPEPTSLEKAATPPPPALRASHADRDAVVKVLQQASGEGRLTLAEFDERAARAYEASTLAELAPLTADLPNGVTAARPATAGIETSTTGDGEATLVAVFGGVERKGRWHPAPEVTVTAVMGGAEIDLRQAVLPADGLKITATAVFGGIDVIVPEGVRVEMRGGISLFGGSDRKVADVPQIPGAPVIHVRAIAIFGGIGVKSKPVKPGKDLDRA